MNTTSKLLKVPWIQTKTFVRHYPYSAAFRHYLQNVYPGAEYTKLQNGLTIATEEQPNKPNACIGFYIDGGSRYESDYENGMTHFFEHLAFKSTRCRSKAQLHAAMDAMGGTFSSHTTREMVCYDVQCTAPKIPLATELLIDCVFNNALLPNDIEEQKKIVYNEMLNYDAEPNNLVFDLLHSAAFQGTELEKPVCGHSSNLYNFDVTTMCRYLHKAFHPTRTVLAAVGAIKHDTMVDLACRYFNTPDVVQCLESENHRYTGSEVRYRDDSMPMCNVILAVEAPGFESDEHIVMELARITIGAWDRSQLCRCEYFPNRLSRFASTYNVDSFKGVNINYKDVALWGVQFIADAHSLDDMAVAVQDEWMYLSLCVTKNDIERAKRIYKAKLLAKMQKAKQACYDLGRWTLYHGERPNILSRLNMIDHISAEDVREVVHKYIYDKCPVVAAVGQVEGLTDYQRLRGQMYWLRF